MRKMSTKFSICIITFFMLIIYTSCSKSENGNLDSNPVGGTVPDTTSATGEAEDKILSFLAFGIPVNKSIYLEQVAVNNDKMTLAIKVKGGTDVYGAVLEITYDSSKIKYESSAKGYYLGGIEDTLFYTFLVNGQEGRLHIAVDKKGNVPGANGDGILATIVVKALTGQVNTAIKFNATISNLMSATSSNPISGTTWLGGSLTYQ